MFAINVFPNATSKSSMKTRLELRMYIIGNALSISSKLRYFYLSSKFKKVTLVTSL